MAFDAKVLADSISQEGYRLTTFEVCFPRFILAEFNTHRVFSRNSASSRAIPVVKQIRRVLDEPFVPLEFGSNQPGMQAGPPLRGEAFDAAVEQWLLARDAAVRSALALISSPQGLDSDEAISARLDEVETRIREKSIPDEWLNVHKQVANRLLEPFMWHTVIVTATEWDNFWNLRAHEEAQPEIERIATMMKSRWEASTPTVVDRNQWHLPLVDEVDRAAVGHGQERALVEISVGRCARVSYMTHAGKRDHSADIELHDRLLESGHMSPLEHPARPLTPRELQQGVWRGNFRGWCSYRKDYSGEQDPLGQELLFDPGSPFAYEVNGSSPVEISA